MTHTAGSMFARVIAVLLFANLAGCTPLLQQGIPLVSQGLADALYRDRPVFRHHFKPAPRMHRPPKFRSAPKFRHAPTFRPAAGPRRPHVPHQRPFRRS